MVKLVPKQGDIIYLDFNPTKGHEQSGIRPALVLSSDEFNKITNMAIVCPITSNTKEFPSHYLLENTKKIKGSVLCEHVRSIDYSIRNVSYVEKLNDNEFNNIMQLFNSLFNESL